MSNWDTFPLDIKCPHCGDARQIERESPWTYWCGCCSKRWPVVTTRADVKDEPQAT